MATWMTLAIGVVTLCFGIYRFYDHWFAGFAYSCETGFVSDYPVCDLWVHDLSNYFVRRFHFGYEARNEQIENSCHSNCFVLRLDTWSSADFGLLSRVGVWSFRNIMVSVFIQCNCPVSGFVTGIVSVVSGTLFVIHLTPYELRDCTANLVEIEVTLAGGSGIVVPFQCNERI